MKVSPKVVIKILQSNKLPVKSGDEIQNLLDSFKNKAGVITKKKIAQKRPRCFQKEKISKLYGDFTGPIVKGTKNGEGIFIW